MLKFDEVKAGKAIGEAMEETVAKLGVNHVRTLSFFPSSAKKLTEKAA